MSNILLCLIVLLVDLAFLFFIGALIKRFVGKDAPKVTLTVEEKEAAENEKNYEIQLW